MLVPQAKMSYRGVGVDQIGDLILVESAADDDADVGEAGGVEFDAGLPGTRPGKSPESMRIAPSEPGPKRLAVLIASLRPDAVS